MWGHDAAVGTGQNGIGAAWGDGFVTDPTAISQDGLSDPRPFFDGLLTKPYANQVLCPLRLTF